MRQELETENLRQLRQDLHEESRPVDGSGAGDGDRTRNFQLGNLNYRFFLFTTYKTAHEKLRACNAYRACIA